MELKLRNYQEDIVDKTIDALHRGVSKALVVLPTGGGKTALFAYLADSWQKAGANVHFYVHRKELLDQTLATFKRFDINLDNIYVGMIKSAMKRTDYPNLVVYDEAHMSTAKTWQNVNDKWPMAKFIGLTATPKRTNGEALDSVFDELIQGVSTKWLIQNKYLSDFDYYAPKLDISIKELKTKGSDYDMADVTDKMSKPTIYGEIEKYLNPKKKTLIYSPSVKFSKNLESKYEFVKHLDGETPKAERDDIIAKFRSGEIMALTSVNLLSEGFDIPDCEVIMLLRPTKSVILYLQQVGRGLRYVEGKRATIYDFVGNVFEHGMPTEEREWSLKGKVSFKNRGELDIKVRECQSCFLVYEGKGVECPYCGHISQKSRAEIREEKRIELEKITEARKKKDRMEVGMAKSLEELIAIGFRRGYHNPRFWAKQIMDNRRKGLKG